MNNLEYMLDSYQKSGTSIEGYMAEAERFDKNTEMVHGNLGTMSIMHLTNVISERKKEQLVYVRYHPSMPGTWLPKTAYVWEKYTGSIVQA